MCIYTYISIHIHIYIQHLPTSFLSVKRGDGARSWSSFLGTPWSPAPTPPMWVFSPVSRLAGWDG